MPATSRRMFRSLAVATLIAAVACTATAQVGSNPQLKGGTQPPTKDKDQKANSAKSAQPGAPDAQPKRETKAKELPPPPAPIVKKNLIIGMPSVSSAPGVRPWEVFPAAYRTPSYLDTTAQDYPWPYSSPYGTPRTYPFAFNPLVNNPLVLNPLLNPMMNNPFAVPVYNPGFNPLTGAVASAMPIPTANYLSNAGLLNPPVNPLSGTVFSPAPGSIAIPATNNGFIPYVVR